MKVSLLSNETNSLDPLAVNSRIFVGNLNTFEISKSDVEKIFQRYGHLTGISMHKGYAFVQFSNPVEAESACDGEDGRLVLNQNIDVNLVSRPKIHQQVTAKQHMLQANRLQTTTSTAAAAAALSLSTAARLQHLMANGAAGGGGSGLVVGTVQPKLSLSIQRRRKRRRQQLNRIRSEFLLDGSSTNGIATAAASSASTNQLLVANHQFSGVSPTLSSSSSSSASTSSLSSNASNGSLASSSASSSYAAVAGQQPAVGGGGEFPNYIAANPQQAYWYPGCYLSGFNINNNYLIPTPVYDNPNEVIDGPSPGGGGGGGGGNPSSLYPQPEETEEVVFYDGNNNPISQEEFILTAATNKSPGRQLAKDVLICGNCRELFHDLEQLLQHRSAACQLRLFCECQSSTTGTGSMAENTILLCRMCRKEFSHPLALLQHVQHVHQIKIFETERDYNPDKDLVATHGENTEPIAKAPADEATVGLAAAEGQSFSSAN